MSTLFQNKNRSAENGLGVFLLGVILLPLVPTVARAGAPDVGAENQLIASVRQKAAKVALLTKAVTNTLDLSEYILVPPIRTETPTNIVAAVSTPPPVPEPVFAFRGVSFSKQRPLALLNNHWVGVGDLVSSTGLRVSKIGNDQVTLVDTQGVSRVVTLYAEPAN